MSSRLKVFFDGGCRPNPGTMEIAVVVSGRATILADLGYGSSMDAEWLALIHALTIAQSLSTANFVLIGDAADVVAKANGAVTCRGAALRHFERYCALAATSNPPRVRYVKRSQNLAGIALARGIRDDAHVFDKSYGIFKRFADGSTVPVDAVGCKQLAGRLLNGADRF